MYCSNPPKTCPCKAYFAGWCFTHQYKNTTQFYFYAALLSSQNTNQKVRTVSESANLLTELYDLCSENRFTCFHVNNIRISNGYPIDSLNNGGATGIFINNEGHWGMILLFVQQPKTLYVGRISNKTIVGWREI